MLNKREWNAFNSLRDLSSARSWSPTICNKIAQCSCFQSFVCLKEYVQACVCVSVNAHAAWIREWITHFNGHLTTSATVKKWGKVIKYCILTTHLALSLSVCVSVYSVWWTIDGEKQLASKTKKKRIACVSKCKKSDTCNAMLCIVLRYFFFFFIDNGSRPFTDFLDLVFFAV